mmetsp:Transcript_42684/g.68551  ORF Transcript_42684/g.68551 Transcript_42684/m.68551 type:complete len:100 (-) Transcript_42684:687-986(-)
MISLHDQTNQAIHNTNAISLAPSNSSLMLVRISTDRPNTEMRLNNSIDAVPSCTEITWRSHSCTATSFPACRKWNVARLECECAPSFPSQLHHTCPPAQ